MNKEANVYSEWRPAHLFLMSALGGAGAFGGARMLAEAFNRLSPPKPVENKVTLDLPEEEPIAPPMSFSSPKTAAVTPGVPVAPPSNPNVPAPDTDVKGMWKLMAAGAGLPIGFLGAKSLYDTYKEKELNQKVDVAKQQYMQQLLAARQQAKMAELTLVDSVCEAISAELNKQAVDGSAFTPEMLDVVSKSPMLQRVVDEHNHGAIVDVAKRGANTASLGLFDTTRQGAGMLGLGATGLTLGALLYANAQKKQREQKAQYPMQVAYGQ